MVCLDEEGNLPDFIGFKDFSKSLALLIFFCVENLDLACALGFLKLIFSRIVKIMIYNMEGNKIIN